MKNITANLLRYALTFALLTIVFRISLSHVLEERMRVAAIIIPILYFVLAFADGYYWGKKDYQTLPLFDLGFRFHLTTYLIFTIISELWFLLGFQSSYENIKTIHLTALIWGGFVLIHYFVYIKCKRKSIKGLDRSDIFD